MTLFRASDWRALYSARGHGPYRHLTRPFLPLWVGGAGARDYIILYEMDANQEINPEDYTDYSNSENCIDPEDYHDDCPSINEEHNGRGTDGEQEIDNAYDNAQEEDNAHDDAQEDNAHEQERHHEGRFSYSEIHDYLASHKYPLGFSKADKLALRKRSKFFQVKDGHLYYTGKCKLAIINSF